jgi:TRAP transporter TAXI family solute receptor
MKFSKFLFTAAAGLLLVGGQGHAQDAEHASATFISGGPTGTWFPTATAISEMVNENYAGQPVSTIPGKGAIGNPLSVGSGKADFGLSYGPFLLAIYNGNNPILERDGLKNLRAIANVVPNTVQIVLAGDVDDDAFASVKDGGEVRIGVGAKGSSNLFGIERIMEEYGTDFAGIEAAGGTVMEGQQQGLLDAFLNRQIDIYTNTVGTRSSDLQQALAARDARLFDMPESIRDEMVKNWGYVKYDIPAGTYSGQDEPVKSLNLSTVVFTTAEMDDEIVYNMVKEMAENRDRLISAYGGFENWQPDVMPLGHPIPTHPGALRYFKEAGWIE